MPSPAARESLATDDAQLVEKLGHKVSVVQGSSMNIKITTKEDLKIAAALLKAIPKSRGLGPIHPFANDDLCGPNPTQIECHT